MAAGEEKLRLVLQAIDKTAAPIRAVNRRIESMLAPVRKVKNAFRALADEAGLPRLGRGLARVGDLVRKLAIGGAAAGLGILEFTRRTAESVDELSEMTRLIGIGIEDFQRYQYAAQRAGVSNEAFAGATRFLAKSLEGARVGTGSLGSVLKKHMPSVLRQIKGAKDTGDALEIVIDAMRRLPDATKRNTLAVAAFGRSAQSMALLAELSGDELRALMQRADDLGGVMSREAADGAESLMDSLDDLTFAAKGLARGIVSALFPSFKATTDQVLAWVAANRALILSESKQAILDMAAGAKELGLFLRETIPPTRAFIAEMGGLKTVLAGVAVVTLAPVVSAVVALGSAIGAAGTAALALGGALAYVLANAREVRAGLQAIGGAFGIEPSLVGVPRAPGAAAAVQAQAAVASQRLDAALRVDIGLDDRRARVARIVSSDPSVQFGNLATGIALGGQ